MDSLDAATRREYVPRMIFLPTSVPRQIWDFVIVIALLFIAIAIPFSVGFGQGGGDNAVWFMIDVLFLFDIGINFRTAYADGTFIVVSPRCIALHYLRTWFLLDAVSTAPLELLFFGGDSNPFLRRDLRLYKVPRLLRVVHMLRALKGLRVLRLRGACRRLTSTSPSSSSSSSSAAAASSLRSCLPRVALRRGSLRMLRFAFWFGLFAHWCACFWFYVALEAPPASATAAAAAAAGSAVVAPGSWAAVRGLGGASVGEQYLTSLYWALTTLTTLGYGDITPHTTPELLFTLTCMVTGVSFFSYITANLTSILDDGDRERAARLRLRLRADRFLRTPAAAQLPVGLRARVQAFFHHPPSTQQQQDSYHATPSERQAVLEALPPPLRQRVLLGMFRLPLRRCRFLQGQPAALAHALAVQLSPERAFSDGQLVFAAASSADQLLLLSRCGSESSNGGSGGGGGGIGSGISGGAGGCCERGCCNGGGSLGSAPLCGMRSVGVQLRLPSGADADGDGDGDGEVGGGGTPVVTVGVGGLVGVAALCSPMRLHLAEYVAVGGCHTASCDRRRRGRGGSKSSSGAGGCSEDSEGSTSCCAAAGGDTDSEAGVALALGLEMHPLRRTDSGKHTLPASDGNEGGTDDSGSTGAVQRSSDSGSGDSGAGGSGRVGLTSRLMSRTRQGTLGRIRNLTAAVVSAAPSPPVLYGHFIDTAALDRILCDFPAARRALMAVAAQRAQALQQRHETTMRDAVAASASGCWWEGEPHHQGTCGASEHVASSLPQPAADAEADGYQQHTTFVAAGAEQQQQREGSAAGKAVVVAQQFGGVLPSSTSRAADDAGEQDGDATTAATANSNTNDDSNVVVLAALRSMTLQLARLSEEQKLLRRQVSVLLHNCSTSTGIVLSPSSSYRDLLHSASARRLPMPAISAGGGGTPRPACCLLPGGGDESEHT